MVWENGRSSTLHLEKVNDVWRSVVSSKGSHFTKAGVGMKATVSATHHARTGYAEDCKISIHSGYQTLIRDDWPCL